MSNPGEQTSRSTEVYLQLRSDFTDKDASGYARIPADIPLDTLMETLATANIPIEEYGNGNAKTVQHLLSEIREGEATMTTNKEGELHREVNVLWADVICELPDGRVYALREDRQEFKDGRVKRRELDSSLGEKIKPSEKPSEALYRAIYEELGIEDVKNIYNVGYDERTFVPDTFPGINSTYKMHKFVATIPESEFRPEGYVEFQDDKTNFYVWTPVHIPR